MTGTIGNRLIQPGFSLLASSMVRFHCRMLRRKRRMVKSALLGVAATALTVKGALGSPIGVVAQGPLDKLKHNVDEKRQQALTQSKKALDQAGARLVASIVPLPTTGGSPSRSPAPTPTDQVQPWSRDTDELPPGPPYRHAFIRRVLLESAQRHHLDPKLVMALSYWESGWDQPLVSSSGAGGLMQVPPATAAEAGPGLLGRPVDPHEPDDNTELGRAHPPRDPGNVQEAPIAASAH